MSVDSVNSTNGAAAAAAAATATSGSDQLGQDSFLQLMIAQMKNQDPTNPADPTEFLSQLAQFSTVQGIQNMQDSISSLSDALRGSQVLGGTSLVGHAVLADGDSAELADTGDVYGSTTIPAGASDAYILVTDASGQQVARIPLATQQGEADFTWDGTTGLGTRAPAGTYKFSAVADVGGGNQQLQTQLASYVNSVSIDPTTYQLTLNTDIGPIALSDVRQVM
ncbi:MAG TPA: flagellar hook assembly protein FlgD [Steroidobacteraceae bacterium]|nr:flagellar hook assembly protein FlgD [Steroidobacteraceae bacterium]